MRAQSSFTPTGWRGERHGVRVADVLPGLMDTPILTQTRNHSQGDTTTSDVTSTKSAQKGMLRLMPASNVAETAWAAYRDPKKLYWYVPKSIRWIDRLKGLSPEMLRGRILKARRF